MLKVCIMRGMVSIERMQQLLPHINMSSIITPKIEISLAPLGVQLDGAPLHTVKV